MEDSSATGKIICFIWPDTWEHYFFKLPTKLEISKSVFGKKNEMVIIILIKEIVLVIVLHLSYISLYLDIVV